MPAEIYFQNVKSPMSSLAWTPCAKVSPQVFFLSTISKASPVGMTCVEKILEYRMRNAAYVNWERRGEGYVVIVRRFPIPVSYYTMDNDFYESSYLLRDLLNYKSPTMQTSDGDLVWHFTVKEAHDFVSVERDRRDNFPKYAELLYPDFVQDPETMSVEVENACFDIDAIFAGASHINFQSVLFRYQCIANIDQGWDNLPSSDPSRKILDQLMQYDANPAIIDNDKKAIWSFSYQQIKDFAQSYYRHSCAQSDPYFSVRLKPITCKSCREAFSQIAKNYNLSPICFYLYQNHIEIPCRQSNWDALFTLLPNLVQQSKDKKNWIISLENARIFFELVRFGANHKGDLLSSFFKSHDLFSSLQEIQIIYSRHGISLFFLSSSPRFSVIEKAQRAQIGKELPVVSRGNGYRGGMYITKEELPKFMKEFNVPYTVQKFVNTKAFS